MDLRRPAARCARQDPRRRPRSSDGRTGFGAGPVSTQKTGPMAASSSAYTVFIVTHNCSRRLASRTTRAFLHENMGDPALWEFDGRRRFLKPGPKRDRRRRDGPVRLEARRLPGDFSAGEMMISGREVSALAGVEGSSRIWSTAMETRDAGLANREWEWKSLQRWGTKMTKSPGPPGRKHMSPGPQDALHRAT